jgi:hypothetical protein
LAAINASFRLHNEIGTGVHTAEGHYTSSILELRGDFSHSGDLVKDFWDHAAAAKARVFLHAVG